MKEEEWDEIINTNLSSVYKISKAVITWDDKEKSLVELFPLLLLLVQWEMLDNQIMQHAKAGIMGFTKSLAREVGVRGITVNAVAPGFIQTDMTDALPENQKDELVAQIPMGRLGTVNEVAQAVLFLAGDSGSYITAQTLHVNGGMYTV